MESRFVTILPLPKDSEEQVTRLFESIQERDPTWKWTIKSVDGETKVLVYSASKNQARLRGEWLTHNTELFISLPFETTHDLTLKTMLKEKPRKTEGIRALLKRDKIWKSVKSEAEGSVTSSVDSKRY